MGIKYRSFQSITCKMEELWSHVALKEGQGLKTNHTSKKAIS